MRKFLSLSMASMAVAFSSYGQLSGVKTINPAGSGPDNYTSFTAAVNALKAAKVASGASVNGTVTFNVTPGVYQERITIDSSATEGASATNQIIFQKDPAASPDAGVFMRPSTTGTSVINVFKASWVTIDGINLEDGDNDGSKYTNRGMQLSGAQHCTFKNFTIRMNSRGQTVNVNSRGIATASSFGGAQYRPLRYNTFDNIRFVNISQRGISLSGDSYGSDTSHAVRDRGNVITNCKFDSVGSGFISGSTPSASFNYFYLQDSLVFANNEITNIIHQPSTPAAFRGVYCGGSSTGKSVVGVKIENNTIDGGADNISTGTMYILSLYNVDGSLNNNIVRNISADKIIGILYGGDGKLDIHHNTLSNIVGIGDAVIGVDYTDYVDFHDNIITNISAVAAEKDATGLQVEFAKESKVYNNKITNIYTGDGADVSTQATAVVLSAAPADDSMPTGGKLDVYNNFVSNVYASDATLEVGALLARGIICANFGSADPSGGAQHIYHNTVVMGRPSDLSADVYYGSQGIYLFANDTSNTASLHANNNIIIDRNTHAATDTSTSYLVLYVGGAGDAQIHSNNYFGYDGAIKKMGAFYDEVQDEILVYSSLADWKAAGLDGTGNYSDSTEVSFADEANGDFHLSDADYINPALRAPSLATVTVDFDGTARAAGNTAKGADAQAGEQDLLISVKNGLAKAKSLTVFPNPATEVARFKMTVEKETAAQIVVRNLMGQVVATKNVTLYAGANTTGINVSGLASGMYVYNVNVNGQSYAGKFVK